jgi:hypothetical protein
MVRAGRHYPDSGGPRASVGATFPPDGSKDAKKCVNSAIALRRLLVCKVREATSPGIALDDAPRLDRSGANLSLRNNNKQTYSAHR